MAGIDFVNMGAKLPTLASAGSQAYSLGYVTPTNCTGFKIANPKIVADAAYTALTASHCTISLKALDATGASTTLCSGTLGTTASGFMGDLTANLATALPFNTGMSTKVITVGNGCTILAYINNSAQTAATGPTLPLIAFDVVAVNAV